MSDEYNPFTECEAYVSEHGTGAGVHSNYWNIPMPNEGVAKRVVELIRLAHDRGVSDNQNTIKKALGIEGFQ
jgi:hypothetical protein